MTPTARPGPVFSPELDGDNYLRFNRYKRQFAKSEKQPRWSKASRKPASMQEKEIVEQVSVQTVVAKDCELPMHSPNPGDQTVFVQAVRSAMDALETRSHELVEQRKVHNSKVLDQFDAHPFVGDDDWIHRRTFKQTLREILAEYLSDPEYWRSQAQQPGDFRPSLVAESLRWKASRSLSLLRTLAGQGDDSALQFLAEIVIPLVKMVNERAGKDPRALGSVPHRVRFWPVLKSQHLDFDEDHQKLLTDLQVGRDYPMLIAEGARWRARDAIGSWAIQLSREVYILLDGHSEGVQAKPWEVILRDLKPFSEVSWRDWWEVALGVLRDKYVDVIEIQELRHTVTAKADLKSPGRLRKRILQALKDKFKSMAGENKL